VEQVQRIVGVLYQDLPSAASEPAPIDDQSLLIKTLRDQFELDWNG
jgi:hypothetical protein